LVNYIIDETNSFGKLVPISLDGWRVYFGSVYKFKPVVCAVVDQLGLRISPKSVPEELLERATIIFENELQFIGNEPQLIEGSFM